MSFDEWYKNNTGINTNDLTDEEYDALFEDEELMGCYESDMVWASYTEDGGEE